MNTKVLLIFINIMKITKINVQYFIFILNLISGSAFFNLMKTIISKFNDHYYEYIFIRIIKRKLISIVLNLEHMGYHLFRHE